MLAPARATDAADSALIFPFGAVPAEWIEAESPTWARMSASAIWDLPAFDTQTNRTVGRRSVVMGLLSGTKGSVRSSGTGGWGRRGTGAAPATG